MGINAATLAVPALSLLTGDETTEVLDLNIALGSRIRQVRQLRGMSQQELGRRIGVTFQQIQKYERGLNRIAVVTLLRVAEALRMSPEALIEDISSAAQPSAGAATFNERVLLLESFSAIADPDVRRSLLGLLQSLGGASSGTQVP
jgi:transcriptional regulator with XRE-family HTH domain